MVYTLLMGVSLSDAMYIVVCYLGLVQVMEAENIKAYMAYGGGAVLLAFGIYYLFIKSRKLTQQDIKSLPAKSWSSLMIKGFVINGLSPMVLFFWLATVGVATTQFGYTDPREAFIFFASIVGTVFSTDVIKAKLADKLSVLMTPRIIQLMNIVLGVVLVIFAGKLILFPESIPH